MVSAMQVRLARRPVGPPTAEDFTVADILLPDLAEGQFLVEVRYISVSPAMRTWISGEQTYRDPVDPGDPMPAPAVGLVVSSRHSGFPVGAGVRGNFGVQDFAVSDGAEVALLPENDPARLADYLGLLGVSGLSAWFGLTEIGRLRQGDTVLISGAAGSVGSAAGQIARNLGCRVVGVAGGPEKCAYLTRDLKFDASIDYREPGLTDQIRQACPGGAQVVFDNVGGAFLEAALDNLAQGARIVVCGGLSQYNQSHRSGPANYLELIVRRATMAGFLVYDHAAQFPQALERLTAWRDEGRLRSDVHVVHGLDRFAEALAGLFTGINIGKLVLAPAPVSQERA
ncbi:MAG: hypothetical protein JWR59_1857 [Brevundimonas sp.]|nr:hypothetical protein [Brevundimonas sp.]